MLLIALFGICVVGEGPLFLAASLVMIASWAFGFIDGPFAAMYAFMWRNLLPPAGLMLSSCSHFLGLRMAGQSATEGGDD